MVAFDFESYPAKLAVRVRSQKGVNLLLKKALLYGGEELFGFGECQAEVLNTLRVLLQGEDIRDRFLTTIIGAYNELKFDTHREAPPVEGWVSNTA